MVGAVANVVFTTEKEYKRPWNKALMSWHSGCQNIPPPPSLGAGCEGTLLCVLRILGTSVLKTVLLHLHSAPEWKGLLCSYYSRKKKKICDAQGKKTNENKQSPSLLSMEKY